VIRYLAYLLLYIPVQLVTYLITPLLPLFAVKRMGWSDNRNYESVEWRLPLWLSAFDTPDNPMGRDGNFMARHKDNYLSHVIGLYRNSLYNWKWSVLSMPIQQERKVYGDTAINHHTQHCGAFYVSQPNGAWQFKMVMPWNDGYSVLNFGWLLDDTNQERALFMFSPRLK
jgi:hypothetical protein